MIARTPRTLRPSGFGVFDGGQRAAAGGDDVFDDDDRLAGFNGAFDIAARAVLLGFLANHDARGAFCRCGRRP